MWKVWTAGDEVYALARSGGPQVRLSVHFSGQIHMHLGKNRRDLLTRPIPLPGGDWLHAFEWRFLLSEDAYRPRSEKLKKGDKAYLMQVAPGKVLIANLLVGAARSTNPDVLPPEFGRGAIPFWRGKFRAGHPVALLARSLDMGEENARQLRYLRHGLNPHLIGTKELNEPPYVEVRNHQWSAGRQRLSCSWFRWA